MLTVAAIAWAAKQPFIFASLGPTAYEQVEQPKMKSARPYNVVVGHFVAIAAGFLALYLLHAWSAPGISSAHTVTALRIYAVTLACAFTTVATLALKANQPAALATTLLISLGLMQTQRDAIALAVGVLILAIIGEPVRQFRMKQLPM